MTPNDVKIVADNIDDFIEVPDGIGRLRKAVLTLAVSGKLVPQDKKEGTAEKLYAKIQARPVKKSEGRKKKASGTSPLTADETPFEIPKSWKWVRLGEIVTVQTGTLDANASSPDGIYPFFTCADEPLRINRYAYDCECVLLAGNGNFNVKYYKGKFEAYQRTYIIEAADEEVFVPYVYLLVQMQTDRFKSTSLGSAMPYIRLGYITEAVVSLPPFLEQKRIVQKVEELLKQLDELEAKKLDRDEIRTRFACSAMQSLGKGESKIAFEQLTELIKTPADIKELEGALLTLAVSGKLVSQDKNDGTAEELYEIILSERAEKGNGGKKYTKKFTPVSLEEIPFSVPTSWKWVPLGSLFLDYGSGSTPSRGSDKYYLENGFNWYKSGELNDSILPIEAQEKVTELALKECRLRIFKPGDFLIAMYGATAGRIAVSQSIGTTNQAVWSGTPVRAIDDRYLYYYVLQSRQILINKSSGAAQPNISGEKIIAHPFALPPLAEQKRIVKKVEEVMNLVAQLRDILGESKASGRGRPKK